MGEKVREAIKNAVKRETFAQALNVNIIYVTSPKPGSRLRAEANRVSETQKTASFDIKITDQDGNIITTCQALAYQTGKPIPFL